MSPGAFAPTSDLQEIGVEEPNATVGLWRCLLITNGENCTTSMRVSGVLHHSGAKEDPHLEQGIRKSESQDATKSKVYRHRGSSKLPVDDLIGECPPLRRVAARGV